MTFDPYILLAKLGALVVIAAALFLAGVKFANDRNAVKMQEAIIAQYQANEAERDKQDTINHLIGKEHADKIISLNADLAAARRAVANAGGLRVPSATCQTFAASAGRVDGPGSGTVALPEPITQDLLSTASQCDEVSEQLRALQDWAVRNELYRK